MVVEWLFYWIQNLLTQKGTGYSYIKAARQLIPENHEELTGSIRDIDTPMLIIWGKNDNIIIL